MTAPTIGVPSRRDAKPASAEPAPHDVKKGAPPSRRIACEMAAMDGRRGWPGVADTSSFLGW